MLLMFGAAVLMALVAVLAAILLLDLIWESWELLALESCADTGLKNQSHFLRRSVRIDVVDLSAMPSLEKCIANISVAS